MKAMEAQESEGSLHAPLPSSTCGMRKLQKVLARGAGAQMNTDIKKIRHIATVDTNMALCKHPISCSETSTKTWSSQH